MAGSLPKGQARPALPEPPELEPEPEPEPELELSFPEPEPEPPEGELVLVLAGALVELGLVAGELEVVGAGAGAVERGLQRLEEVARFFFATTAWWRLWRAWWVVSTVRAATGAGPKDAITARQEMARRLSNLATAMSTSFLRDKSRKNGRVKE